MTHNPGQEPATPDRAIRSPCGEVMPFTLVRDEDVSGVSGTGVVADGMLWPDGTAVWKGDDEADRLAKAKADCEREGITP